MGCGASVPKETFVPQRKASTEKWERKLSILITEQTQAVLLKDLSGEEFTGLDLSKRRLKIQGYADYENEEKDKPTSPEEIEAHEMTKKEKKMLRFLIDGLFVFRDLDSDQKDSIVERFEKVHFEADELICKQGEMGEDLFLVDSGSCYVFREGVRNVGGANVHSDVTMTKKLTALAQRMGYDPEDCVSILKSGDMFGELSLLFKQPRLANVVSPASVSLWRLNRIHVVKSVLQSKTYRVVTFLRKIPIFSAVPDKELYDISKMVESRYYKANEVICEAGTDCEGLFIVQGGSVNAFRNNGMEDVFISTLNPTLFFGDRPLVTATPLDITYQAGDQGCGLLLISRKEFFSIYDAISEYMSDYLKFTVLKSVHAFQCLSLEELVRLVKCFEERTETCGSIVCEQGMLSNQFYIVARGKLIILKDNKMRGILHEYSFFGERAIRDDDLMKMTAVVDTANALIFSLSRARFEEAVGTLRSLESRATCVRFLNKVEILSTLTESEFFRIAGECVVEEYCYGETIINEGDVGTSFYLLTKGKTEVRKRGSDDVIMSYDEGMYFGERALLEDEPRSASVTVSSTYAQVLRIDREAFNKHLHNLKDVIREHALLMAEMKEEKHMQPKDFDFIQYLGVGMYGRVKLLSNKKSGKRYALKCISKSQVMDQNVEKQLARECQAAMVMTSYFTARVINCFIDSTWIYMLTEIVPGGELFYHLHLAKGTRFTEKKAKFYIANVLLGLEFIHRKSYAYRDLKLENIILDHRGYAKIVDFGFAKFLNKGEYTYTVCGTPEYIAPEVITYNGHNHRCDYWSLGILTYELLVGETPFYSPDQSFMLEQIASSETRKIEFPHRLSEDVKEIISFLLVKNQNDRIGAGVTGIQAIMNHSWFDDIDFNMLSRQKVEAPLVPDLSKNGLRFNNSKNVLKRIQKSSFEPAPRYDAVFDEHFRHCIALTENDTFP